MTPSFPSERKRVKSAKDRSPDLRLLQLPSQKRMLKLASSGFLGPSALGGKTQAEILPSSDNPTTGTGAGALTVAGQWRNFTAFPCILAIAVVN